MSMSPPSYSPPETSTGTVTVIFPAVERIVSEPPPASLPLLAESSPAIETSPRASMSSVPPSASVLVPLANRMPSTATAPPEMRSISPPPRLPSDTSRCESVELFDCTWMSPVVLTAIVPEAPRRWAPGCIVSSRASMVIVPPPTSSEPRPVIRSSAPPKSSVEPASTLIARSRMQGSGMPGQTSFAVVPRAGRTMPARENGDDAYGRGMTPKPPRSRRGGRGGVRAPGRWSW
jgi:hypothetical protein